MQRHGSGRQPELGGVWIDPMWKTISWASWVERLSGSDIVVEIKQSAKIEWAGNERFKIVKKNLSCCSLNKKLLN
jgi:CRISPR/Cas system-associated exonuclease Cas4 (RecB family)